MVIHHVNETLKTQNVSSLFRGAFEPLLKELKKCILLCGNHHLLTHALQKRTANEAQYQKHQKVIPFPSEHRGAKAPPRRRSSHPAIGSGQLRDRAVSA